jgi:putative ubiquitin-RnfH superfamily antitoxin RatB of RatAB toxin-antitoxin module
MAEVAQVDVEICYATPELQVRKSVQVAVGTTVQEAIMQSGLLRECTAIDLTVSRVGIYGKLKTLDTVVRAHDRIEIYRPLIADPKDSRRRRVEKKGA